MAHEARKIFEVAPEAIDLFRRKIYHACSSSMNAVVSAVAKLHRAHNVERSDGKHIRGSECDPTQLCIWVRGSNAEADQIDSIAGNARPHCLSWFLLRKDCDTRTDFTQTVQSYQTGVFV